MTDKTTDALAEARASVALDKGETETRCVDDFGGESVTHSALEDPIATLRELLENHGNREERAALDALATTLAEKEARIRELKENALRWLELEATRLAELQADADKAGNCYGDPVLTLLQLIEMVDLEQRGKSRKTFRAEVARSALELMQARIAKAELRVLELEKARLAVPEGELAEAIAWMDQSIEAPLPFGEKTTKAFDAVMAAARSWARLQWRKASEAPIGELVLAHVGGTITSGALELGRRLSYGGWVFVGYRGDVEERHVIGWLPLDALPQLPPTPGASDA